jgi:NADH dehydrogenase (ubiquinone) 1 alpha subcomplex subunit 2
MGLQALTPHWRQFIQTSYPLLKKNNPDLPVLIREVQDTPARVFARFGACFESIGFPCLLILCCLERGVEKHVELDNLSSADVERKVSDLLTV